MKQLTVATSALFAATLLISGCSKSADTSSNTSADSSATTSADATSASNMSASDATSAAPSDMPTATASAAPPGASSAAPNVSETSGQVSVTQGSDSGAFGKATADDFKSTGLPLYAGLDPTNATVIKNSSAEQNSILISATTTDDFATVDAWYAAQLGSGYETSRVNMGDAKVTTFDKKGSDGGTESSVSLTAGKPSSDGKTVVTVMLLSKSKP